MENVRTDGLVERNERMDQNGLAKELTQNQPTDRHIGIYEYSEADWLTMFSIFKKVIS